MSEEKKTYKDKLTEWLAERIAETDKEIEKRERLVLGNMQCEMKNRETYDTGIGKHYYTQRILEEAGVGIQGLLTQRFVFSQAYDFAKKTKE